MSPGALLPYIQYKPVQVCAAPNVLTGRVLRRFVLKTGIDIAHFGLRSGMVFAEK